MIFSKLARFLQAFPFRLFAKFEVAASAIIAIDLHGVLGIKVAELRVLFFVPVKTIKATVAHGHIQSYIQNYIQKTASNGGFLEF